MKWNQVAILGCLLLASNLALGESGEGLVALQDAEGSCPAIGSDEIYTPCENGTVTDNRSGLVWLGHGDCFGPQTWADAMAITAGLADEPIDPDCGLADGSSPGEWRLPTKGELLLMVADALAMDCDDSGVAITNDIATGCWTPSCPSDLCSFISLKEAKYWTSTTDVRFPFLAREMNLDTGETSASLKTDLLRFWPVRGGQ